jgi:integrase/recombinase XerD
MKLHDLVTQYVAFRKALGAGYYASGCLLRAFSREMGEKIDVRSVRPKAVSAFLAGNGRPTRSWHQRYYTLLCFYRYAVSRGYVKSAPLPKVVPKLPSRFVPYVYSREELRRLLDAVSSCQRPVHVIEPPTLRTIILLLYGAGLRISEALNLNLENVDLTRSVLTVQSSKFFKSRLVPVGKQLAKALTTYSEWREVAHPATEKQSPFFVNRNGSQVNCLALQNAFKRLRDHTGIHRTDGGRCQPRLHDLRHSFAVHRLISWYEQGADVQRLLPTLSVYLGHINIASTQVYLTMTPELLQQASVRFERYARKEAINE